MWRKTGGMELRAEAEAVIQAGEDGGLNSGSGCGGAEQWMESRCVEGLPWWSSG